MIAYPNPAGDLVSISFMMKDGGDYVISLEDMIGRTIWEREDHAVPGPNSQWIDLEGIAHGVYMIILHNGNYILKSKLVVE